MRRSKRKHDKVQPTESKAENMFLPDQAKKKKKNVDHISLLSEEEERNDMRRPELSTWFNYP